MSTTNHQSPPKRTAASTARSSLLGCLPLRARIIFYGLFFLSVTLAGLPWLAYRIDLHLPSWHVEVGWFRLVGAVIFAVFFVVYIRSSRVLTLYGRGAYVEFDPPTEFVTSGPYRWCRNPVAGCVVVMLFGEAIAFSSTGMFLLFLASLLFAHLQVVLLEEPLLRRRFGQSYAEYAAHVPRWIPRPPREDRI